MSSTTIQFNRNQRQPISRLAFFVQAPPEAILQKTDALRSPRTDQTGAVKAKVATETQRFLVAIFPPAPEPWNPFSASPVSSA
ncbi:MAG: hypothetical protein HYR72_03665 [Deltaproteobacteria bacterium]|nr:hypothetical protein [Deltaproteobacteria bacterium]MBI3388714.1 hypothetical protein [Deltaproteobacteria bacterium]